MSNEMSANSNSITSLSDHEIEQVSGGILQGIAAAVGIAIGLVYFGGELHDAYCTDHK